MLDQYVALSRKRCKIGHSYSETNATRYSYTFYRMVAIFNEEETPEPVRCPDYDS